MSVRPYSMESVSCTMEPDVERRESSTLRRLTPRCPRPKEKALRCAHVSPSSPSSSQLPAETRSFTRLPNSPAAFEKMREPAPSVLSPAASSSRKCFRMKFCSAGSSSAAAARRRASSRRSTTFAKVSRKMPLREQSASTRGRPSSSSGMSSKRTTRPVCSWTGRAPMRPRTTPTLSPRVLMASRPQRFTAMVSGYAPVSSSCSWIDASAMARPRAVAVALGMRYGSRAWMLRPVGSTPAPSRSRSPPGAGRMYSPFSARRRLVSSSPFCRRSSRIEAASLTRPTSTSEVQARTASSAAAPAQSRFRASAGSSGRPAPSK
mmetsp:Transcript_50926/g.150110  ORF Transcript_50926/g.150110 Transcript_50926/m.150110 type:complete len:320 (-) Transcript_50926:311-1270(-)